MKTARLPDTDSIDELAKFWDTHDLTDFEDQLEEVAEPVFSVRPEGNQSPTDTRRDRSRRTGRQI